MREIILASTSPYRQKLLQQLQLPFVAVAPDYEEIIDPQVAPSLLVRQLALGKAQSLADVYTDALIIGSDQVFVDQQGMAIGKPGDMQTAFDQLRKMNGKSHTFFTGLALLDSCTGEALIDSVPFSVTFRQLSDQQIWNYLEREKPMDCAGSFKIEGLGIALMEKMAGEDYNSLIGLPLIRLVGMLEQSGVGIFEGV